MPGPMPTAIAESWSSGDAGTAGRQYSIAGASASAWRGGRRVGRAAELDAREHAALRARARRRRGGSTVSIPSSSIRSGPRLPTRDGQLERRDVAARQRPPANRRRARAASSSARRDRCARTDRSGGSSGRDRSPHSTTVTRASSISSSKPRSCSSWIAVEAVDVDVRDRQTALVLLHDRERRARDRLVDAEAARRCPCANVVLPAPRSPASTTTSPARRAASRRGRDRPRRVCVGRSSVRIDHATRASTRLTRDEVGARPRPAPAARAQHRRRVQRRDEHRVDAGTRRTGTRCRAAW